MGPELLQEYPEYSVKVDIWALGVMYHQMLFGRLPFNANSMFALQALFKRIKKYTPPKNISPESRDVLCKMLNFKPLDRISATELL